MKNTAAYFLLSQGFEAEDIVEELAYEKWNIDVAAVRDDGTIVGVECETKPSEDLGADPPTLDGHKIFLLTEEGLYEPYGPLSTYLQPVDIQLTIDSFQGQRVGRWFADGREPELLPEEVLASDTFNFDGSQKAHDGYDRWVANGEPKQKGQPSPFEVFNGEDG